MFQNIQNFSLALLKIAARIRQKTLKEKLEGLSYSVLENYTLNNSEELYKDFSLIKTFISFGATIYEVEPINAQLMINYIGVFHNEVSQKLMSAGDIGLSKLLKQLPISSKSVSANAAKHNIATVDDNTATSFDNGIVPRADIAGSVDMDNHRMDDGNTNGNGDAVSGNHDGANNAMVSMTLNNGNAADNGNGGNIAALIRQQAVLEQIRQSGNGGVGIKDLIAEFPDVSERTLRYDLQRLCLQGYLGRVGNGGPGTFYVIKS